MATQGKSIQAQASPVALLSRREQISILSRSDIFRLKPEEWSKVSARLMELEEIYPSEIRFSEDYKKEEMTREGSIALLARADGKIIGEAYGSPLSSLRDEELAEDNEELAAFKQMFKRYVQTEPSVFYLMAYDVDPEYRERGTGTALSIALMRGAAQAGFSIFASHSKEPTSANIARRLGGKAIFSYPDWYGTKSTYTLVEARIS